MQIRFTYIKTKGKEETLGDKRIDGNTSRCYIVVQFVLLLMVHPVFMLKYVQNEWCSLNSSNMVTAKRYANRRYCKSRVSVPHRNYL